MKKEQPPEKEPRVTFKGHDCVIQQNDYVYGGTALELIDVHTRESVTMATVSLSDYLLPPDEVFIKDYSENEGLLKALEDAGIVKATGDVVQSGYVRIPRCKVLIPIRGYTPEEDRETGEEFDWGDVPF